MLPVPTGRPLSRWSSIAGPGLCCWLLAGCAASEGSPVTGADTGGPGSTADASTPTSSADPSTDAGASTATGGVTTLVEGSSGTTGDGSTGDAAVDLDPRLYGAEDPNIQYSGRIDFTDPSTPTFSAPGVYIKTHFRGISATVHLEDQFVWDVNRNFYEVIVDDTVIKLAPEKGVTRYTVATGLVNTEHSITLVKRTESALGWGKFKGFEFEGEIAAPPPKPARKLLFIGDSITCGSGNEAANNSLECTQDSYGNQGGWGQPYHNNWLSYGAVAARSLDAEYQVTAVSGIGLVRNYSFLYDARPMPEVYDLLFLELQQGSPAWDPQRFVPDGIVIALGTNDFSPGDSPRPTMTAAEFAAAYLGFVGKLRADFPNAHIFGVSSPMLADGWPAPTDQSLSEQKTALAQVEAERAAKGDFKVHKFDTTKLYGEGCGTHPSVAQDATMAAELADFMQMKLGW